MMRNLSEQQPNFSINTEANFTDGHRVSYKQILKRIWPYGLSIFLVFFISMAVYPAITVLIESQAKGKGYAWNDVYFVPVITYLTFSCGDYLGRLLCGHLQWVYSFYLRKKILYMYIVYTCICIYNKCINK